MFFEYWLNHVKSLYYSSEFVINLNEYHWYAFIRTGAYVDFYLDGISYGHWDIGLSTDLYTSLSNFGIGIDPSWSWPGVGDSPVKGQIDDLIFKVGDKIYTDYIVPTQAYSNLLVPGFTMYSVNQIFSIVPSVVEIILLLEEIDSIVLNTDLKLSVSRDNKVTYTEAILNVQEDITSTLKIVTASIDVSSQLSGSDFTYKLESFNFKDFKIRGIGVSYK